MLVHIKKIIKDAQKKGYILGAFNIHNLETAIGVIQAAKQMKSPAIIQVSEGTIKYMGIEIIVSLIDILAKTEGKSIPIALHLDHGKSLDVVKACVKAGFSSVHRDASALPLRENIAETKKAVIWAKKYGVWVQGEVGTMLGGHGKSGSLNKEIPLADPEEVKIFLQETKVDTIAAAVGTAHGVFTEEKLDIPLVKKIKKIVNNTPLIMHGGSGLTDKEFKQARRAGINVVNIGTDIKASFSQSVIKTAITNKQETDPRVLLTPAIIAVKNTVMKKMKIFGSNNKA